MICPVLSSLRYIVQRTVIRSIVQTRVAEDTLVKLGANKTLLILLTSPMLLPGINLRTCRHEFPAQSISFGKVLSTTPFSSGRDAKRDTRVFGLQFVQP